MRLRHDVQPYLSEKMKVPLCSAQSIPQTIVASFSLLALMVSRMSLGQVKPFSQITLDFAMFV
jgi:hypothetical protein